MEKNRMMLLFLVLCLSASLPAVAFGVSWTSSLAVDSTPAYDGHSIVVTAEITNIETFDDTPDEEYPAGNEGVLDYRWYVNGTLQAETSSSITLQNGTNGITGPGDFDVVCEATYTIGEDSSDWTLVGSTIVTFFKVVFHAPNGQAIKSFNIIAGRSVDFETELVPVDVNVDITYMTSNSAFAVTSIETPGTLTVSAPDDVGKTANVIACFNNEQVEFLAVKAVEVKVEVQIVP
ncbi:MAG: hypothetical protein IJT83_00310 [Victivallales bacterium]|nr:hypothetical protein [Victivallales bacterium]